MIYVWDCVRRTEIFNATRWYEDLKSVKKFEKTSGRNVLSYGVNCDVNCDAYVNNMNLYNIEFISLLCSKVTISCKMIAAQAFHYKS